MRTFLRVLFLLAFVTAAASLTNGQTNTVTAPAGGIGNSAVITNCFTRLDQIVVLVEALAQAVSNDTVHAQCVTEKLNSIKSLVQLAHSLNESFELHQSETDVDGAVGDQAMILIACERADKLATEAAACRGTVDTKNRKRPPASAAANNPANPPVAPAWISSADAVRDETTCVKQVKLAALLAQAMGLDTTTPSGDLAKLTIEPLGGWKNDECATVDDLCVVVARALKLKVESPGDPYSYVQAARVDGLPVDHVLPRRRANSVPAVLLESEVRTFLARGYAATLPK